MINSYTLFITENLLVHNTYISTEHTVLQSWCHIVRMMVKSLVVLSLWDQGDHFFLLWFSLTVSDVLMLLPTPSQKGCFSAAYLVFDFADHPSCVVRRMFCLSCLTSLVTWMPATCTHSPVFVCLVVTLITYLYKIFIHYVQLWQHSIRKYLDPVVSYF